MKKDDPKYNSKRIMNWKKKKVKRYELYFNLDTDGDIVDYLETIPSKRQYIIELIRKEMKKH